MRLPTAVRRSLLALACSLTLASPLAAQRATPFFNGLSFALVPTAGAEHAELALRIPAGIVDEPNYGPGVARLTAAILLEGTVARSKAAIAKEVATMHGEIHTAVDDDGTTITLRVAPAFATRALNLLADIVRHPTFDGDAFQRVIALESTWADSVRRSLEGRADGEFHWLLFPNQPLGRPVTSTTTLEKLKPGHLRNFADDHYGPIGASLTVRGPFDEKRAAEVARAARLEFSDWEAGDGRRGTPVLTTAFRSAVFVYDAAVPPMLRMGIPVGPLPIETVTLLRALDEWIGTTGGDATPHLVSRGGYWVWEARITGPDVEARATKLLDAITASRGRPGGTVLDVSRLQTVVAGDSTKLSDAFIKSISPRP